MQELVNDMNKESKRVAYLYQAVKFQTQQAAFWFNQTNLI